MADPQTPQDAGGKPLFDMSKATPIQTPAAQASKPLFDMSKATPIAASQPERTPPSDEELDPTKNRTVEPGVLSGVVKGAMGGLEETTAGIGGLIQKIPVVGPKLIPEEGLQAETKQAEQLQQTPSEKAGAAAETVGEFLTGDAALESGLAKLGELAAKYPHVIEILEKFPKASRTILKGATVGGIQGGVQESRPGGEGAVKGAEHGAAGGAVGATAAELTGAVAKPVAKAMGIATSAEEDIARAAQPGKRNYRFLKDWSLAKDRIAQEVDEGGTFKNMGEAADRIRDVRQNLWKDEVEPAIAKHANETMFPSTYPVPAPTRNPVSVAIRSRISPSMQKLSPENAAKIEEFAKKYDGPLTVKQAEEDLEHLNAELTDAGYWKKTPDERAAAEKANPEIGAKSAAVGALRNSLYNYLESAGETRIKGTKATYGALANVEKEIRGQVNVGARQRPLSLKQIIALASGHPVGIAASLADKIYNSPEELLNRAVSKSQPAGPIKAAAKDVLSGAGTVAAKSAPAVGSITFRASDGSIHTGPADQWDKVKEIDPGAEQVKP